MSHVVPRPYENLLNLRDRAREEVGKVVIGQEHAVDLLLVAALDRTESKATDHPFGAKGVGETGTIAAAPAVINAVIDALSHLGVTDIQMPATPERVWRAIEEAQK